MTSNPRRAKGGGWAVLAIVGLLVALPVLYVASVGPVARLACDGSIAPKTWAIAYRPLLRAADHWPPIDSALCWYSDKWGAHYATLRVVGCWLPRGVP
jgi:hypothetical protein